MRYRPMDDHQKRRLTEKMDILRAVQTFQEQGMDEAEMLSELLNLFYVDLDEYHEITRAA
ncbi:hypothetical protein NGM99_20045 [Mesorhizobium sp. RP14(2022)]|uniref:Transcriptional regulator n=1 Tax=Mesorhizobium liriopis TaxID=2953882 RepID=A0ABT1CB76_9HYPH|nr:hypothetical protein [Mesorhizobium liriopis]MCO6052082.1 hypothetical protein [Mesorhizobium liriopis]